MKIPLISADPWDALKMHSRAVRDLQIAVPMQSFGSRVATVQEYNAHGAQTSVLAASVAFTRSCPSGAAVQRRQLHDRTRYYRFLPIYSPFLGQLG